MDSIDPQKTVNILVRFMRTSFAAAGFSRAVIGLSGGIDSATSCALAVRALGKANIYPLLLPYGDLNAQGVVDALSVVKTLQIPQENICTIDMRPVVDAFLAFDPSADKIRTGNAMARARMMVLFDRAKKHSALVVGTENKTEHLLGYFTRFGDEASDIEPLRNLYKTQIYTLASHLGLPNAVVTKKPTAGLWEGQTDEKEFGFAYKDADEILFLFYDKKKTRDLIVQSGFPAITVDKVLRRAKVNGFKHHLPMIPG